MVIIALLFCLPGPVTVGLAGPLSFRVELYQGTRPPSSGLGTRRGTIQSVRIREGAWAGLERIRFLPPRDWAVMSGPLGGVGAMPMDPGRGARRGLWVRPRQLGNGRIEVELETSGTYPDDSGAIRLRTRLELPPDRWTEIAGQGAPPADGVHRTTRARDRIHIWLKVARTSP